MLCICEMATIHFEMNRKIPIVHSAQTRMQLEKKANCAIGMHSAFSKTFFLLMISSSVSFVRKLLLLRTDVSVPKVLGAGKIC